MDDAEYRSLNPKLIPDDDLCLLKADYLALPGFSGALCINSHKDSVVVNYHISWANYNYMSYAIPMRFVRRLVNWHQANVKAGRSQIFMRRNGVEASPFWLKDLVYMEDANKYLSAAVIKFRHNMLLASLQNSQNYDAPPGQPNDYSSWVPGSAPSNQGGGGHTPTADYA